MKLPTALYLLAVLVLPFSAAMKQMLELSTTIWLAPALILGVAIFILVKAPIHDRLAFTLAIFGVISGVIGSCLFAPSTWRMHSNLYAFYAEPARLCLMVVWYLVSVEFLAKRRNAVIVWLVVSAGCQLLIAIYLYCAMLEIVPVPDGLGTYLALYKTRQAVKIGQAVVFRMSGTFIEGPPFGLFMLSCFIIFTLSCTFLHLRSEHRLKRWLVAGIVVSFIGAVASFSDGVLVGLVVFGLAWYVFARPKLLVAHPATKLVEAVLVIFLLISLGGYTAGRAIIKWQMAKAPAPIDNDVLGDSGAERMFHIQYGIGRFAEVPLAVLTGIGPGRYGDYATRTGMFPPTVDIAFMPAEWLVEYGLIGLTLIVTWIKRIGFFAYKGHGALGIGALIALLIADCGQANWLWEGWFLALAFLQTSGTQQAVTVLRTRSPRLSLARS